MDILQRVFHWLSTIENNFVLLSFKNVRKNEAQPGYLQYTFA